MYQASKPRMNSGANRAHPLRNNVMPNADPNTIVPSTGPTFMVTALSIVKSTTLSMGAKVLYPRLVLYAGKNGVCFPSQERLAEDIGVTARQVRRYLTELHDADLIDWTRTKTTCKFTIYSLEFPRPDNNVLSDRTITSTPERTITSDKKMSLNRGLVKDVDIDCSLPRKRAADISLMKAKQYPALKHMLAQYRATTQKPKLTDYPSDALVVEVMHAANGQSERWVMDQLKHLHDGREFYWGVQGGPYSWAWFPKVIAQRDAEQEERRYVPDASEVWDYDGTRVVS